MLHSSLILFSQDGTTPLYIASQEGHSDIVNTLIRNGAAVNQPCNVGENKIQHAHSLC